MNTYHCMVALKDTESTHGFSVASEAWFEYLCAEDLIKSWRIMRRKLPLATGDTTDFIIEVEVVCTDSLERTFPEPGNPDTPTPAFYQRVHAMIDQMHIGPSRPYLEYEEREAVLLH